jgi:hypothetical protein
MGWGLPLAAVVGTGALAATQLSEQAVRPVAPPVAAASAGRPSCAVGPRSEEDFNQTPEGFLRFPFSEGTDYREFFFARAIYSDGGRRGGFGFGFGGRRGGGWGLGDGGPSWSIDYANADRHIVLVARRLSNIDACEWEHPVSLADPDLRRFPFIYSLEWGYADLTEAEVEGLRSFLEAGGLLMIDDFWGTYEWENFERQMSRVLPGRAIREVPRDHLLFHIHYTIDGPIIQVPGFGRGLSQDRSERDGYVAHVRGIFDDDNRLMVVINWNTDLGDALEHAENPYYPLHFSTFASELFLNIIMYSMMR